jgi:hypothetical protein
MGRLQARLAALETKFIPDATRDEAVQRALAKLTIAELKQLMEAETLKEAGREGELTEEHHAAIRRQDELVAEEQALASGRR